MSGKGTRRQSKDEKGVKEKCKVRKEKRMKTGTERVWTKEEGKEGR